MTGKILPFNPLDKKNLGASVAEALVATKAQPLGDLPVFSGAGIYAIYYFGNFPAYAKLANHNRANSTGVPVYVGKAVPAGARKGVDLNAASGGKSLYSRLNEHAESVRLASNLDIKDFSCRYLVVDDIWIPLGESLLIARYSPVWNSLVDGFGNHDPGKGRYEGLCPRWDALHPGRAWAAKCRARDESPKKIAQDVVTFLSNATFPTSDRFITPQE